MLSKDKMNKCASKKPVKTRKRDKYSENSSWPGKTLALAFNTSISTTLHIVNKVRVQ